MFEQLSTADCRNQRLHLLCLPQEGGPQCILSSTRAMRSPSWLCIHAQVEKTQKEDIKTEQCVAGAQVVLTVQEDVQAVHFVCSTIVTRKLEMSHTMEHSTMETLFRYQRQAWCLCLLTH